MAGTKNLSARDFNNLKGVNIANGTVSTDVAAYGQVTAAQSSAVTTANSYTDSAIAGLASGQTLKGTVRAASTTPVTIVSPGSTIDGLTPATGEIFLLTGQSTGTENGPYTWNGASTSMTRALNWDSTGEAVVGSYWIVREGTNADSFALMTNDSFTLGSSTAQFRFVGLTSSVVDGYSVTCPSTSAGGTWTVTHNLNTRAVIAQVFRVAAPYDLVDVTIQRTTTTTVSVLPDVSLASGEYEIMVKKVV